MSETMDVRARIESELARLERSETMSIVYACESGSRAWGFESQDSDYDVRFIYVRPAAWYLSIEPGRDVVELPMAGNLDIAGWDIAKALNLFRKSNPPLLEWLQSPIVYRERLNVISRLRSLMPQYYSPIACYFHYLHMAEGNRREYLGGEEVWIKKYFYVLRPILACIWIERGYGVVPTEFAVLVERVVEDSHLREVIADLLRRKKGGDELARGPRIPAIADFVDSEITRLGRKRDLPAVRTSIEELNECFRAAVAESFGPSIMSALPAKPA